MIKISPTDIASKKQLGILIDTIKNPLKGKFLGGITADEAERVLKSKFKYTDAEIEKLKESIKMKKVTESQKVKVLKKYINEVKREMMKEDVPSKMLDSNELKVISAYINGLSAAPHLDHATNDQTIKKIARQVSGLRIEMMRYVEENSNYKFIGKSPNGWKLVKK